MKDDKLKEKETKYKEAKESIKILFENDRLEFCFKGRIGFITCEIETPNFKKRKVELK